MRAGRVLVALALVAAGVAVGAPTADAWTDGVCPTAEGVTVVIDFQELGGGVQVRCATGAVTTGFGALQAADINYQTAVRQPGFLCKIAGLPGNDPCINTSPASAYWSYWLAPRGGQWCYSNWGAGNRTPPQGSVEGWSFVLNKSASTTPTPRLAVPAPVPGSPANLAANDCDPSSTAPKATTTTAAPVAAPPPVPAPGGSPAAPSATSPPPAVGGATPTTAAGRTPRTTAPAAVAGATTTPAAPGTTVAPGEPTPPAGETTTVPGEATTTTAASSSTTGADDGSAIAATRRVDLSAGNDAESSPVALFVTLGIVAALAAGGVAVRVRRSR